MPAFVSANVPSVYWLVAVWIFGGFIALVGALCFAELTTTYPDRGGDYGYLKRAYHRRIGFAFSWAAFWVIRPGNIGALSMIFGEFANQAFPGIMSPIWFAVLSVSVISGTNLLGIMFGKTTQNILTVAKVVGILLIFVAAFVFGDSESGSKSSVEASSQQQNMTLAETNETSFEVDLSMAEIQTDDGNEAEEMFEEILPDEKSQLDGGAESSFESAEPTIDDATKATADEPNPSIWSSFWIAMVFVMFAFGGWNDIAFVASEVRNPQRNLLRSLVIGTGFVLIIYLLVNFALVYGLGFDKMAEIGKQYGNPTSVLVEEKAGDWGLTMFATLVCVSCLGSINAMIFTSPRIYSATAADYPWLSWLAADPNSNNQTDSSSAGGWWRAMLLQGAVTILLVLIFGMSSGGKAGIDNIVTATAPYFWMFLALTVVSLIVNRIRYRGQFEGYRVPLYPVLPLIFVSACGFMAYQAWNYLVRQELGLWTALIGIWVLFGLVLSFVLDRKHVINETETAD